jgi:hypothetical protein
MSAILPVQGLPVAPFFRPRKSPPRLACPPAERQWNANEHH